MALQKDGNVGIGETSPSAKLDINGGNSGPDVADLIVKNSNSATVRIEDTTDDNQSILHFKTTSFDWTVGLHGATTEGKFKISNHNQLGTNDYLTINRSGNVGIGTNDPKANLQVHQTTKNSSIDENNYDDGLVLSYDGGYNEGDRGPGISFAQRWHSGTANSFIKTGAIHGYKGTVNGVFGGGLQFYSINSGGGGLIERMRIDNVGNVGIGTNDPKKLLEVSDGSGDTVLQIKNTQANVGDGHTRIRFAYGTNDTFLGDIGMVNGLMRIQPAGDRIFCFKIKQMEN